jgi:hypothetical protein
MTVFGVPLLHQHGLAFTYNALRNLHVTAYSGLISLLRPTYNRYY